MLICLDTVVAELLQQLIIVESEISERGRTGTFCLVFEFARIYQCTINQSDYNLYNIYIYKCLFKLLTNYRVNKV